MFISHNLLWLLPDALPDSGWPLNSGGPVFACMSREPSPESDRDLTNSSRPGEGLRLAVVLSGTQISFCCPLFALRLLAFHCSLPPVGRCRSHFVSFTSAFRAGRGDGGGANPSVPSAGKAFAFPETPELPGCQSFARRLLRGPQNERAGAGNAREVAREQSQLH